MNARKLEFASMVVMMLGIVALCQPWLLLLHSYSVLIIIIGLVASVVSTCQANASSSGGVGLADGTATRMVSSPCRMKNSQTRSTNRRLAVASSSTRARGIVARLGSGSSIVGKLPW